MVRQSRPIEHCPRDDHALIKRRIDHYDHLAQCLTDEQKSLLSAIDDDDMAWLSQNEAAVFAYGFRMGAKFMAEIMYKD